MDAERHEERLKGVVLPAENGGAESCSAIEIECGFFLHSSQN
jgi:hypothetical protein